MNGTFAVSFFGDRGIKNGLRKMKACIFSAIAGALAMLLILMAAARIRTGRNREAQKYEHTDYVSSISKEACFVCGETPAAFHWGGTMWASWI